jgi:hypothetical protein
MQRAQAVIRYPSLRSLKTIVGARHELARLYHELKKGLIEPQVAGRLTHILSILIGSHRDHDFEQRLVETNAMIAETRALLEQSGVRIPQPNGNGAGLHQ